VKKKEDFQKLIDTVINRFTQSNDPEGNLYVDTVEILYIFKNLNEQIEENNEIINRLSKKVNILDNALKILTKELVKKGYLMIGEKRNFLKRNAYTLEALTTLLDKNKIISKKELLSELKKKRELRVK